MPHFQTRNVSEETINDPVGLSWGLLQAVDVAAGKTLAAFATHFFPGIDKAGGAGHRRLGQLKSVKRILNGFQIMEFPKKNF